MKPRHILLALLVTAAWGGNFVVIAIGLQSFPPLLLAASRFMLAAVAVFFCPRPDISWTRMAALGLTWFIGQFSLLFVGMAVGMPPGLASVVLQAQIIFTMALAAAVLRELPGVTQAAGIAVALAGLVLIGATAGSDGVSVAGFMLVLAAALCWAAGNIVMRGAGQVEMLPLIAWTSLVPIIPLLGMSWYFEGPERMAYAMAHMSPSGAAAVLYLTVCATFIGYGGWGKLLKMYPTAAVGPFSLLIPVFGAACAYVFRAETFGPMRLAGMGLILAGLAVAILAPLRKSAILR